MNKQLISAIQETVKAYPDILPSLSRKARYIAALREEVKTQDHYARQIWDSVVDLYRDGDEGAFIDSMAQNIEEQLTKAFRQALRDNELDPAQVEEEPYAAALEEMILNEFDFVDRFANDILAAREAESGFDQFQSRADMWAARYDQAYNTASVLIASEEGNNLIWEYDPDKENCSICAALNGIVAKASVWEELGVFPQNPPNPALDKDNGGCGGWQCGCSLTPTEQRQSPKAYDLILNAVSK